MTTRTEDLDDAKQTIRGPAYDLCLLVAR